MVQFQVHDLHSIGIQVLLFQLLLFHVPDLSPCRLLLLLGIDGHLLHKQLEPLVPVPWVNLVLVAQLLVDVSLIGDIQDGVQQAGREPRPVLPLGLLPEYPDLHVSRSEHLHLPLHLLLHAPDHLLLPPVGIGLVQLPPLLVPHFPQLPVLRYHVAALPGPELLVTQLRLLLGLSLHPGHYLRLPLLLVHVRMSLRLIHYHLPSSSFPLFPGLVRNCLLVLGLETGRCQGHAAHLGCHAHVTLGASCGQGLGKLLHFLGGLERRVLETLGDGSFGVILVHVGVYALLP